MTAGPKTRAPDAQLAFEALSIEGGLLSPEWLAKVAQLAAKGQSEHDYRVPKGLSLRDEIGRYWRIAQAHWAELQTGLERGADPRALADRSLVALLRESFGFASLQSVEPKVLAERTYPVGFCALGGRVPVVIAPGGSGVDTLSPDFGDGSRRRSAFGLAQEYLNAEDGALWGIVTDGSVLRILRDNASLTRPAWIEADLERIFREELFADFTALWLLAHETRFGRPDQPVAECALEAWREAGRQEGTRARDKLRSGVEEALAVLGQGFLAHPDNTALRSALQDGSLTTTAYFQELLRLVYRLIFLLTVEERGLLHPDAESNGLRNRTSTDGGAANPLPLAPEGGGANHPLPPGRGRGMGSVEAGGANHPLPPGGGRALGSVEAGREAHPLPPGGGRGVGSVEAGREAHPLPPGGGRGVGPEAKALYAEGYSIKRLRERAVKRGAHDRFFDQWEAVKIVFRGLDAGEPRLALPALKGLFAHTECPHLDASRLQNSALMLAMFRLSWLREPTGVARVNWRDMGPEELGSVYESLLELVPQIQEGGRRFTFLTGAETKGNARKTSGSYYTPDSLVQVLLDSALEPVVESTIAANPKNPAEALLKLSIVDPACGSGHFLLAAARRLAAHVARLRADGTPSAGEYRAALRQVVAKCIYGVDLNPMAVELCKVSLWMEAVEPGLPLTFLDSHIRQGNALLGTTPELMEGGIPDNAWKPIEGDDKKIASALRKRNKSEAKGQRSLELFESQSNDEAAELARALAALDQASDADPDLLAQKEAEWARIQSSAAYQHQRLVADAWCAAFVWPKQPGPLADAAPTNAVWRQLRDNQGTPNVLTVKTTEELRDQYSLFHWHLAFPQVFEHGGFDIVLGNPPWEASDLMKVEFFAALAPSVARAATTEERLQAIDEATQNNPQLKEAWATAQRSVRGESHFLKESRRYPFSSRGKLNTYRTFTELSTATVHSAGRLGLVVKSGIVNAQDNQAFFESLLNAQRVAYVRDFINTAPIFPSVVSNERFCLLVCTGTAAPATIASFMFCLDAVTQLGDTDRELRLEKRDLAILNPMDLSVPPLTSRRDLDLLLRIHSRIDTVPGKPDEEGRLYIRYQRGHLNSSTDSKIFSKNDFEHLLATNAITPSGEWSPDYQPLLEGKLIASFNHRFGTFLGVPRKSRFGKKAQPKAPDQQSLQEPNFRTVPRFWLTRSDAEKRIGTQAINRGWQLAFRHVCRSLVDARTAQVCVTPSDPCSDSCALLIFDGPPRESATSAALLLSAWTSFPGDYVLRQKLYGPALTKAIALQLPTPTPEHFRALAPTAVTEAFVIARVLELTYTAWDLEPFACDVGYEGPPFRWDPERRFLLRAELDAAFFHLYGISRDDADYILDTFPIVRKNDEKAHGEYRTKRVILEIYDDLAHATQTGLPYQTRLDPPPADPRVAHPPREP